MRYISSLLAAALLLTLNASAALGIGLLIPNDGQRPFDVESHRATVTITNNAAVTRVEQVFRNHTDRPMEAVFLFPVPDGATVSDFSLWINGNKTKGAVLEKNEARAIYESIVRQTRDPGLVEYIDGKLFRASIFPIPPRGTQKLELKFAQVLQKRGGMYHYDYPIRAGSKYVTATTEKDFTVTVDVNSTVPLANIYSPSHTIGVHRKSPGHALVGTEEMRTNLDRDFELYLSYSKKNIGVSMMTHDPDGEGGEHPYFMMALAPSVEAEAHDEIGQTFTFVMDTSGSMAGQKIKQARRTLEYCIARLKPQDHFNVIRFSTDVEPLFPGPVQASRANKETGRSFATELAPAGGTAIHGAMVAALSQDTPRHQPHQIIFVTDGMPTVGPTTPPEILSKTRTLMKKNSRIFSFGVGYEVNTVLLDAVAAEARGRSDYVRPNEDLKTAVAALYDRISSPVLSDISIDFGGARVYDVYPNPIPDLFQGDQLVLFGRMRSGMTKPVKVAGRIGNSARSFGFGGSEEKERRIEVGESASEPLEFLPRLWSTRKVGYLLDQIRLNGEQPELKKEIIRLAKKYGLVTPYTSYLAVDDSEFQRPREIAQPQEERDERRVRRGAASDRPSTSSRPRKSTRAPEPLFDGFGASSGESAVEASEATREYKEAEAVASDDSSSRRFVANRTFALHGDIWIQDGLSPSARSKTVKAFSKEYFALVRKHPELKRIVSLGDQILVKLGHDVYRIQP